MIKPTIKAPAEIKIMAEGGRRLAGIKSQLVKAVRPGITTNHLEHLAEKLIADAGGKPSFKMVPGYHWATCINVNDVVVHGIPSNQKLKLGDVVGIDVGIYYNGFHTDTSISTSVGSPIPSIQKFLEAGRLALKKAISAAKVGKRVQDISAAMQQTIERAGYSPVQALVGHGVGRHLHEEPQVPCFVIGPYSSSPKLAAGLVLAIEVMYNQGSAEVAYQNDDGWTIVTADGKISGLFEETVAVTAKGPVVLTA